MKSRLMGSGFGMVVLACLAVVLAQTARAQAIPRTPDGKPDLSGTWVGGGRGGNVTGGVFAGQTRGGQSTMELTKWGRDKFNWNRAPEAANAPGVYRGQHVRVDQDPLYHCYPAGLVRLGPPAHFISADTRGGLIEIIQTPGKVMLLFQYHHEVRHIFTDGREHPKNLELTWNGHSIGRWDGDTLVVDTIGLRDESWLDSGGHEHSTQLHVVERFRRVDADNLEIERTLTDPVALAKPFTVRTGLKLSLDMDLDENLGTGYDCTQFMMRKPAFGDGIGGVMGISEPPAGGY
ncbi:MAG: hypothetical protein IH846_11870 [Acidobacteria bacterium]|nr:hypothetical protein [Acidobacteriota bacterium]